MFLHVLFNEGRLVRTKVTNQGLGDVITTYLFPEPNQTTASLLLHLFNFILQEKKHARDSYKKF